MINFSLLIHVISSQTTIFFVCLQFSDPSGVSGGGSRGHRGHDSFEGGGGHSVLSSAATMAIDNSVTEEPSTSAGTTP